MSNRINAVVTDIIESIRDTLKRHNVTIDEFHAVERFLTEVGDTKNIPPLLELFFEKTIVEIEAQRARSSTMAIQGPFFLEGAPEVTSLKVLESDAHQQPLVVRGTVKDPSGAPVSDAIIDVWHSTSDGRYSGIHDGVPPDCYRGKIRTGARGAFEFRSIVPVPYPVPGHSPLATLLRAMDRDIWRPAHVHIKVRKDGYRPLTTQLYLEGGAYLKTDCAEGVHPDLIIPNAKEGNVRLMPVDFVIEPVSLR